MAVPLNCSQNVSLKEKMLFLMTVSRISRNKYDGKSGGMLSALVFKNSLTKAIPVVVSMKWRR